jgi:hypothetical protein
MLEHCLFLSTETSDPVSAVIRWYTDCDWSHCGWLRLADGWTYSAMFNGGVQWRPPNPKAKILKLSAAGIEASLSKALSVEGAAYDLLDILGIATGRNWSEPGEFICDKLVFWAQDAIGCPLVNMRFIPLIHLKPRDILLSPDVIELG